LKKKIGFSQHWSLPLASATKKRFQEDLKHVFLLMVKKIINLFARWLVVEDGAVEDPARPESL